MSIRVHSRNAAAGGALGLLVGTADGADVSANDEGALVGTGDGADASADGEDAAVVRGAGLGVVDAEGPHPATAITRLIRAAAG
jgi:hypothetical protein